MTPQAGFRTEEDRLEELRRKVHDEEYLTGAILRIAQVLSVEILDGYGAVHGGGRQGLTEALGTTRPR